MPPSGRSPPNWVGFSLEEQVADLPPGRYYEAIVCWLISRHYCLDQTPGSHAQPPPVLWSGKCGNKTNSAKATPRSRSKQSLRLAKYLFAYLGVVRVLRENLVADVDRFDIPGVEMHARETSIDRVGNTLQHRRALSSAPRPSRTRALYFSCGVTIL